MSDPDNFLSRWSRRKRGAIDENSQPGEARAQAAKQQLLARPTRQNAPDAGAATPPPPEFDVTSLPPIESIEAGTDISIFMQKGVPSALRHAALRRAWSADPAIRDFMGPTENYWDTVGPEGVPGFGELDPGFDVKRMVSQLFGESGPEGSQADMGSPPKGLERTDQRPEDHSTVASERPSAEAGHNSSNRVENAATQKQPTRSQPIQKMTRRHGGAMPE